MAYGRMKLLQQHIYVEVSCCFFCGETTLYCKYSSPCVSPGCSRLSLWAPEHMFLAWFFRVFTFWVQQGTTNTFKRFLQFCCLKNRNDFIDFLAATPLVWRLAIRSVGGGKDGAPKLSFIHMTATAKSDVSIVTFGIETKFVASSALAHALPFAVWVAARRNSLGFGWTLCQVRCCEGLEGHCDLAASISKQSSHGMVCPRLFHMYPQASLCATRFQVSSSNQRLFQVKQGSLFFLEVFQEAEQTYNKQRNAYCWQLNWLSPIHICMRFWDGFQYPAGLLILVQYATVLPVPDFVWANVLIHADAANATSSSCNDCVAFGFFSQCIHLHFGQDWLCSSIFRPPQS